MVDGELEPSLEGGHVEPAVHATEAAPYEAIAAIPAVR